VQGAQGLPGVQGPAGDPAALLGEFVETSGAGRYAIVAGGEIGIGAAPGYNDLRVQSVTAAGIFTITYKTLAEDVKTKAQLVVKVTPVFNAEIKAMLLANYIGVNANGNGIGVRVTTVPETTLPQTMWNAVRLMVEVSKFNPAG
jgi:hypothetical protein